MDEQPSPSRGRPRDDDLNRALGRTIKVLRTERGLGRKDLAREVGMSYSYLTEIENGTKPASSSYLSLIAEVLRVPFSELIEGAEARLERTTTPDPHAGGRFSGSSRPGWSAEGSSLDTSRSRDLFAAASRTPIEFHRQAIAPPTTRRRQAMRAAWPADSPHQGSLLEDRPGADSAPAVLDELAVLLPHMDPDDQRRLLDMARRLAR